MSNEVYLSGEEKIRYVQDILTDADMEDPYHCAKLALQYAFLALEAHRNKVLIEEVPNEDQLYMPRLVTGILDSVNIDYAIGIDESTKLVYIKTLPKKVS